MIDDKALVGKILGGDIQAFRLLIHRHEKLVVHMIGRLVKNAAEREELCQDVFLKVHDKLGDFSFQSRLSTWIAAIAYRHAINHLRKQRMLFSELPEEGRFAKRFIDPETPESIIAGMDLDRFILHLIDELPEQYKTVISLYHVEEMSYPEICEITGMPEGTVKSYLFRARNLLKESVKKYLGNDISL